MKLIILILIAYSLTFAQLFKDEAHIPQPDTVYFPFYNDSVYLVKEPWSWYDDYAIKKELMMYELHGFLYGYLVRAWDSSPATTVSSATLSSAAVSRRSTPSTRRSTKSRSSGRSSSRGSRARGHRTC